MRITHVFFLCGALAAGLYLYTRHRTGAALEAAQRKSPLSTITPQRKTIRHTIATTGILCIKDSTRIGSLVGGTVHDILVKENDQVEQGQLLAVLDDGKSDAAVRLAKGHLQRAQAQHGYLKSVYLRTKELFEAGHAAAQDYEDKRQLWLASEGDLIAAQASLDLAEIEFNNKQIRAPENGIIVAVGIKKGLRISTDLNATVLFETAKDITRMEAELEIDESDVCHIRKGHKVTFTVDSYPGRVFKGAISDISFSPVKSGNELIYRALLDVDNKQLLLRPGMTIHAVIKIAKAKDSLSLATQAFYFEPEEVAVAAKVYGYTYQPLNRKEKKGMVVNTAHNKTNTRYVWTINNNILAEKAVQVAAYDNQDVEVCGGLEEGEQCLIDIVQDDKMSKHYKNLFKGAL